MVKGRRELWAGAARFLPPAIRPRTSLIALTARQSRAARQKLGTQPPPSPPSTAIPKHLKNVPGKRGYALLTAAEPELIQRLAAQKSSPEMTLGRDMNHSLPDGFRWMPSSCRIAVGQQTPPVRHHRDSANRVWHVVAVDLVTVAVECSRPFAPLAIMLNTFHGRAFEFSAPVASRTHFVS